MAATSQAHDEARHFAQLPLRRRVFLSLVTMLLFVLVFGRLRQVRAVVAHRRTFGILAVASVAPYITNSWACGWAAATASIWGCGRRPPACCRYLRDGRGVLLNELARSSSW